MTLVHAATTVAAIIRGVVTVLIRVHAMLVGSPSREALRYFFSGYHFNVVIILASD